MLVLLDEHLPRKLARELTGHDARTVRELGWGALKNGALLRQAAAEGFGAMVTMDRRIPEQQNLIQIGIAVVIVTLRPFIPEILRALVALQPGTYRIVGIV